MTNQASELFELCKEVYERTGWDDESDIDLNGHWCINDEFRLYSHIAPSHDGDIPLYTSDYLLEKLPYEVNNNLLNMNKFPNSYEFRYGMASVAYHTKLTSEADTPLKALLKLTIALSEAGELK